jgi:hypothetical protein
VNINITNVVQVLVLPLAISTDRKWSVKDIALVISAVMVSFATDAPYAGGEPKQQEMTK